MTERIVDCFEVIEIDAKDRNPLAAVEARPQPSNSFLKLRPVGEVSQAIMARQNVGFALRCDADR